MYYSRLLSAFCAMFFIFTSFSLTAAPITTLVPATPFIESADTMMFEDTSDFFTFQAGLGNNDGSEYLTVTVTGIDPTWTIDLTAFGGLYDAMMGAWTIVRAPGQNYTGGFGVTSPADSDVDMTGLTITATSTLISKSTTDSVTVTRNILVDAVADIPTVSAFDVFGITNSPIDLSLSAFTTDTDGSETITDIFLSSLPGGTLLSAGTDLGSGMWQLSSADLIGLTMITDSAGVFSLTMDTTSMETSITDFELTTANNTAIGSTLFDVTVSTVPVPAAVWLFGSGLISLVGVARYKKAITGEVK